MTATLLGNIKGPKGDAGKGIVSITNTSTSTNTDTGVVTTTYTITFSDSTTSTFEVKSGATGAQGIQGPKGDDGEKFEIAKTYTSLSAMNAAIGTNDDVDEGKFVIIASPQGAEDVDNAKLYLRGASDFSFVSDLSGAKGIQGVSVLSVTAGPVSGTASNGATRTYNVNLSNNTVGGQFTVQDGLKGDTGKGIQSITRTGTNGGDSGLEDTYTISYSDNSTSTFVVTNGAQGSTGATGQTGAQGEQGLTPVLSLDESGNLYVEYMTEAQRAAAQSQQSGN